MCVASTSSGGVMGNTDYTTVLSHSCTLVHQIAGWYAAPSDLSHLDVCSLSRHTHKGDRGNACAYTDGSTSSSSSILVFSQCEAAVFAYNYCCSSEPTIAADAVLGMNRDSSTMVHYNTYTYCNL